MLKYVASADINQFHVVLRVHHVLHWNAFLYICHLIYCVVHSWYFVDYENALCLFIVFLLEYSAYINPHIPHIPRRFGNTSCVAQFRGPLKVRAIFIQNIDQEKY